MTFAEKLDDAKFMAVQIKNAMNGRGIKDEMLFFELCEISLYRRHPREEVEAIMEQVRIKYEKHGK